MGPCRYVSARAVVKAVTNSVGQVSLKHTPQGRAEGVFVGGGAPHAVVLALGEVAEADGVIGRGEVGVAQIVVVEIPADLEQGRQGGIVCPGG
ncbi:hypothetical protein EASAB2608_01043 [Streptomyces sp. EAS-AB2608]|nr:hypothetical protein EASAB2608_01043 [Streptomyces sp. EAS-AB2608]